MQPTASKTQIDCRVNMLIKDRVLFHWLGLLIYLFFYPFHDQDFVFYGERDYVSWNCPGLAQQIWGGGDIWNSFFPASTAWTTEADP